MAVADASPLIALAKIHNLALLGHLYGGAVFGEVVRREVVDDGRAAGAADVHQIELAIEQCWIQPVRLTPAELDLSRKLARTTGLGSGEMESIALASQRKLAVILDDKQARAVAAASAIPFFGTAAVLLEACRQGHLDLEELPDSLGRLAEVLWLSPSVVTRILRLAKESQR